jgi:hypothetical protein
VSITLFETIPGQCFAAPWIKDLEGYFENAISMNMHVVYFKISGKRVY